MTLRDNLKSEKAKERYDRNFNSVEITFTQIELELHDAEIRNNAIDEFVKKMHKEFHYYRIDGKTVDYWLDRLVDEIAKQMKAGAE